MTEETPKQDEKDDAEEVEEQLYRGRGREEAEGSDDGSGSDDEDGDSEVDEQAMKGRI